MARKYNSSLLHALNEVRAGKTKSFVIGYTISKSLLQKANKDSIVNRLATGKDIENDIINAFESWKTIFNALYSSNRKIKGGLQMEYKNNNDSSNNIHISIKKSNSKQALEIKGSTIFLSSNFNWKALRYNTGLDIFSHIVYAIGKILYIPESHNRNSIMSSSHLKINYAPFYELLLSKDNRILNSLSILDKEVSKNILKLYGSMRYSYPIVYGCTDINAANFNPRATRSDTSCKYRKIKLKSTNSSNSY
jgi:hypothetical protein